MKKKFVIPAAIFAAVVIIAFFIVVCIYEQSDLMEATETTTVQKIRLKQIEIPEDIRTDTFFGTSIPQEEEMNESRETDKETLTTAKNDEAFKINILGKTISVAHGVEENILRKNPGWLSSSAYPGEDGICVIYGHRNRAHLRILEKVKLGDAIIIIMPDGIIHNYSVYNIEIYENTKDMILPTIDEKALVLATCYPFRYSGSAPGKCLVTAICDK